MPYRNYHHMDGGLGVLMVLGVVALWALVAVIVVMLVRASHDRDATTAPRSISSAEQILAERLARGEIDPAEYRERLEALGIRPG